MVSVYIINCSASNSFYVGISNDPDKRWKRHKSSAYSLNKRCNHLPLQRAIKKYGKNSFSFKVMQTFATREEACQAEKDAIKFMREMGFKLYNITEGGDSYELSEYEKNKRFGPESAWRANMSKINSGSGNPMFGKRFYGKDNPNYGKAMKPHVRKILLKIRRKITDEQIVEIKELYSSGDYTQTALSKKFKVSLTAIHCLVRGKTFTGAKRSDLILKPQIKAKDVVKIRTHYANKTKTIKELEIKFNLAESHIKNIVRGRKWKSAGGPITTAESELSMRDDDVIEIKKLWATGNYSNAFLADKFGICKEYAWAIITNKSRVEKK